MPETVFEGVAEWPAAKPAPAHFGHNKPPLDELIPEEFRAELLRERPDFLTKMKDLVGAAERAKADDDESLGRCGNLVKSYRALLSHITETHKVVKQPHLDAGRLVDAEKNALTEAIEQAKRRVESIGNAFVAEREAAARAERERIAAEQRAASERALEAERAREEAERAAVNAFLTAGNEAERVAAQARADEAAKIAEEAMAAAALAPAAQGRAEPVRSEEGATVSGKQEWVCEVTDYEVAFMGVSDDEKVREAIDKAVARRVKAGSRKIEGVRIWPVAKANFR